MDKRVVYWLAEMKDPEKEIRLSEEHLEFKWVNFQEASTLANYPDFLVMLGKYQEIVQNCLLKH